MEKATTPWSTRNTNTAAAIKDGTVSESIAANHFLAFSSAAFMVVHHVSREHLPINMPMSLRSVGTHAA